MIAFFVLRKCISLLLSLLSNTRNPRFLSGRVNHYFLRRLLRYAQMASIVLYGVFKRTRSEKGRFFGFFLRAVNGISLEAEPSDSDWAPPEPPSCN